MSTSFIPWQKVPPATAIPRYETNRQGEPFAGRIEVPTGVAMFPRDIAMPQQEVARQRSTIQPCLRRDMGDHAPIIVHKQLRSIRQKRELPGVALSRQEGSFLTGDTTRRAPSRTGSGRTSSDFLQTVQQQRPGSLVTRVVLE